MYTITNRCKLGISVAAMVTSLLISSCGGGGSSSGSSLGPNPGKQTPKIVPITIDNLGTVPIINNNATSSVIYVHNNTDHTISGITFTEVDSQSANLSKINKAYKFLLNKLLGLAGEPSFIDQKSAAQCSTLGGGATCMVGFTTPRMNSYAGQGSTAVSVHYTDGNKAGTFSQIVNYANVTSNTSNGVQIMSGGQLSGFGNPRGFLTVYAYGTGANQNFKVNSITTSAGGIVNGNVSGATIQSDFVQAIEISSPISDSQSYGLSLNINSTDQKTGSTFSSTANNAVVNPSTDPHLLMGLIPVVDTFTATGNSFPVTLVNTSTSNITGVDISGATAGGNVIPVTQCDQNTILAGSVCTVNYTIPQYAGSGTISASGQAAVTQTTVGATQPVVWFNSKSGALLGMEVTPNPVVFNGVRDTGIATITVTNQAGFDVSNIDVSSMHVIKGMARVSLVTTAGSDNCTGQTVAKGAQCTYQVSVTDSKADANGLIYLYIKGRFQTAAGVFEDYSRVVTLNYTSQADEPILTISADFDDQRPLSNMAINGNNKDNSRQTVRITNEGDVSGTVTELNLLNVVNAAANINITLTDVNCINTPLAPKTAGQPRGGSCTAIIQLGPQSNGTPNVITNDNIQVAASYNGGTIPQTRTVNSNGFTAIINPNSQSVIIALVTADNTSGGTGAAADPYIFSGAKAGTKSVTITYQNNGTDSVMINGFDNAGILPTLWSTGATLDTCTGQIIKPSQTCTLTFVNQLAANFLAVVNLGAVFDMPLQLPGVVFTDQEVPGKDKFYDIPTYTIAGATVQVIVVQGRQATVANSVTIAADSSTVTVTHSLANATDGNYVGNVGVNTNMENYFTTLPTSPSCTITPMAGSNVAEACSFNNITAGGTQEIATQYTVDKSLASQMSLHFIYVANPLNGVFFAMTPQRNTTTAFPAFRSPGAYVVNQISPTDNGLVLCNIDTTNGTFSSCSNALTGVDFDRPIIKVVANDNTVVVLAQDGNSWICPIGAFGKLGTCMGTPNMPTTNSINLAINGSIVYFITKDKATTNNQIFACQISGGTAGQAYQLNCANPTTVGVAADMIFNLQFANDRAYVSYGDPSQATTHINVCSIATGDGSINCAGSQDVNAFPSKVISVMVDANNVIAIGSAQGQQVRCAINADSSINAATCASIAAANIPVEIATPNAGALFSGRYYYSGSGADKSVYTCSFNAAALSFTCQATTAASPFTTSGAMAFVQ